MAGCVHVDAGSKFNRKASKLSVLSSAEGILDAGKLRYCSRENTDGGCFQWEGVSL